MVAGGGGVEGVFGHDRLLEVMELEYDLIMSMRTSSTGVGVQSFTTIFRQGRVNLVICKIRNRKTDNGLDHFCLKRMLGHVRKRLGTEFMGNVNTVCLAGRRCDGNTYGYDMITADRQIQGKRIELMVLGELMRRDAIPYMPLADVEGVNAVVSVDGGRLLRIQIKARGFNNGKAPLRLFRVDKLNVAADLFVVCVEAPGGVVKDVWILPSIVFDAYATHNSSGVRDLNLDSGKRKYGLPLYDVLCGFRNRWELITEYDSFKDLLDNPDDLEDVLTMKEALESPEEEIMTLDEYEQLRRAKV